jgi:hypothetical protein
MRSMVRPGASRTMHAWREQEDQDGQVRCVRQLTVRLHLGGEVDGEIQSVALVRHERLDCGRDVPVLACEMTQGKKSACMHSLSHRSN